MRSIFKQRGFLLNPYRFAGTTQSGAFGAAGVATHTAEGAAVASAPVASDAAATLIVENGQATSGAIAADAASTMTMVGAALNGSALDSAGQASATLVADSTIISVDAADFDGTNDYLTRSSFTGQANTKTGIVSVWFRVDALPPATVFELLAAFKTASLDLEIWARNPINVCGVFFGDGTGTLLQMSSSVAVTTGTWYHMLASWDLASSTTHFYLNDVDRKNVTAGPTNRTVPLGSTDQWSVGTYPPVDGGGDLQDGGIAELYFAPGQYLDLSVEANRRKFISSGGKPVNLGATGSVPTGTAPLIYLHLDDGETANNFAINRAGNGNLTVTGALTTYASSPSD